MSTYDYEDDYRYDLYARGDATSDPTEFVYTRESGLIVVEHEDTPEPIYPLTVEPLCPHTDSMSFGAGECDECYDARNDLYAASDLYDADSESFVDRYDDEIEGNAEPELDDVPPLPTLTNAPGQLRLPIEGAAY